MSASVHGNGYSPRLSIQKQIKKIHAWSYLLGNGKGVLGNGRDTSSVVARAVEGHLIGDGSGV